MNTKNNRRSRATKKAFRDTLVKMIVEKGGVDEITIKNLCEEAQVNRSTFYAYYQSVHDIVKEIDVELSTEIKDFVKEEFSEKGKLVPEVLYANLLPFIKERRHVLHAMFITCGYDYFQKSLIEIKLYCEKVSHTQPEWYSDEARLRMAYKVAGVTRVIELWMESKFALSVEKMTSLLVDFTGVS